MWNLDVSWEPVDFIGGEHVCCSLIPFDVFLLHFIKLIITVDPWTTQGFRSPDTMLLKMCVNFWFPPKFRLPFSLGIYRVLFPRLWWVPKFRDSGVPYLKWCRAMQTVGPPHPWSPNLGSENLITVYLLRKKSVCKWTYVVQTYLVQGSTVCYKYRFI